MEQAEKELSLTAQRRSAEEFAARHGAVIERHYVEPGASGTDTHRTVFNELLGDALRPGSDIATIVVHHTSRFSRDATHARVVKKELRRAGGCEVGRAYALHLVERIDAHEERVVITPKEPGGRKDRERLETLM